MTTRLRGLVLALALGVLGLAVAPMASAAPTVAESTRTTTPLVAAQPGLAQEQQPTPEPGPSLDPSDKADSDKAKNKTVAGVVAGVLAVIVVWGRHIRNKRSKSSG